MRAHQASLEWLTERSALLTCVSGKNKNGNFVFFLSIGFIYYVVRRFPMSAVPTDSEQATAAWLHKLYQEKVCVRECSSLDELDMVSTWYFTQAG